VTTLATVGFQVTWYSQVITSLIIFIVILQLVPILLLAERKLLGRFQGRYGPNRVGPFGALQPLVDIVKLAAKEDFAPRNASKAIFIIAPMISLITAIATIAIVPFGNTVTDGVFGANYTLYGIDVSIGVLYAFAFGAISFYGLMLGGWASGSKYSFLGAMRSAAQLISYELAAGLSLVGVVMMSGSLSMTEIVNQQDGMWFIVPQFVGFLTFFIAGIAETNRAPFDLPEAEQELVAGYHTEYSGMRWGLFQMAEYINMLTLSALTVTLFLGGWHFFWLDWLGPLWFLLKLALVVFVFIWLRATFPRIRYDQLMAFGWKVLLPVATINAVVTAVLVVAL
jgi:NADH-quinone oxidoreductase subunit H